MKKKNKFYLEASIEVQEETGSRFEKASQVIDLPKKADRQVDLMYFSAIFVSTGTNLNNAHFLGSELVAAEDTIINKALDIEHEESEIIGHIYERAFIDKEGNLLSEKELASRETASLDEQDMHIAIAGIIYKTRFPNIAQEVADGKFKVSMECYYQDCDIKVGDMIVTRKEAEVLGLAAKDDKVLGHLAKVIKDGKEIASGHIARVLRGICFSGCGIVENPANPPSVIMETAKEKDNLDEPVQDDIIVLNYDILQKQETSNNVTSEIADEVVIKKQSHENDADNEVDASNTLCNQEVRNLIKAAFEEKMEEKAGLEKHKILLTDLKAALCEAVKTQSQ